MKKTFFGLLLILVFNLVQAQSVLYLGTSSRVTNTIIYGNPYATLPVTTGVSVTFSASELTLPTGNNVHLPVTPFSSSDFRVDMTSLVFDRGSRLDLSATDTLDLDFNTRVSCEYLDIGAFEHQVLPTAITQQPEPIGAVCEGAAVTFHVAATGQGLTFQWQRNGVNIVGATCTTLAFPSVTVADTGYYRVIVIGACCNDTSNVVRLDVYAMPMVVAMDDVTILSGQSVTLYVISYVGTVTWLHGDFYEPVLDLNITNILYDKQFFAIATNGVCADTVFDPIQIIVDGFPCLVVSMNRDTMLCAGEPLRLLISDATVTARWFEVDSAQELVNGTVVWPTETTRFALVGFDDYGNKCHADTFMITLHLTALAVRSDETICRGETFFLYSTPVADYWFDANDNVIGSGNITILPPEGVTTTFRAERRCHSTGCLARGEVSVTVNPPALTTPLGVNIGPQLYAMTVCEGALVHLQTNIDPIFIIWERLSDGYRPGNDPTLAVEASDVFRANAWDPQCGDISLDLIITVLPIPDFFILPFPPVYYGTTIDLISIPNTPIWLDAYGNRVSMPITPEYSQYFTAILDLGYCQVTATTFVELRPYVPTPPPPPPPPTMQATFSTAIATVRDCDNATVTINVTGGTPPYDFEWTRVGYAGTWHHPDNLDGELRLFNVTAGVYNFVIFDSEGYYIELQIPVRCEYEHVMPSILVTPNNDGLNDYLFIRDIEFFPINTVTIINSYGAEIFRIENYCNFDRNRRWAGQNNRGGLVPDGTYWYVVQAQGVPPMTGWIIVRGSPGR